MAVCLLLVMLYRFVSIIMIKMMSSTVTVQAQPATHPPAPVLDPSEATTVFMFIGRGFGWENQWNTSEELCSGAAIDDTPIQDFNPGIKCDCSYDANTTCHVTAMRFNGGGWGPLPDAIWNTTYLTHLDLGGNDFNGSVSASIRHLTRLQYLNLTSNMLSGELPRELGLLSDLRSLYFSENGFSGPLPMELGSLLRLRELYFCSSGVSGPIPQTFANLRSIEQVWASDNELTGQIPEFIGNWSNLTSLRFQGNSFQGPIPLSLTGLTLLRDLRISDVFDGGHGVFGGGSSLDFLVNMNNLHTLVLRNNNITGGIPSFFYGFQNLFFLDLSFNRLTGDIPTALFSTLSELSYVYLGSNGLTGGLPLERNLGLQVIDLSYNGLNGRLPSWITEPTLQINLVGNYFDVNDINSAILPGLDCLQRNFPCNQGSPIYSSFAINCGGPELTSGNVVYERDLIFGPARYYVSSTGRWAVSNSGLPFTSGNQQYRSINIGFGQNDPEDIIQTSRVSVGSLRYYGLGLENGIYTVRLVFGSLGIRRIFDIYIQGNLVVRDFDILSEVGGRPSIVREFTAAVRDNHLEIHLFWAGKGSSCEPTEGAYGPSISAISATPNFIPTVGNNSGNRRRIGSIIGIIVAICAVSLFCLLALCYVAKRRRIQKSLEDEELLGFDARPYTYTYSELKAATNDFDPANKLGEGGFGSVYKGTLGDGRLVAVKQLSVASHHGNSQFVAEIATISAVQHRNLVKLYGCCVEGVKRLLVYEYHENKSLDRLLFGMGNRCLMLGWPQRYDICLGVARGLAYLHEESRLRIVHRDVKASNILLDVDLIPKVADFGLAKLYDDKMTHISTRVAGTLGYLAPEYAMRGHLTEKADIFSFGVVALEMISGRPNCDLSMEGGKIYLLEWAWNLHENNRHMELVDPTLHRYDETSVRRIIGIGLLCTQGPPGLRPSMSRVVGMLTGDVELASITSRPSYLTDWNFSDASSNTNVDGKYTDPSTCRLRDSDMSIIYEGR